MINTPEDEEDERRRRRDSLRERLSARGRDIEQQQTPVKPEVTEDKQRSIDSLRARLAQRGDNTEQQEEPRRPSDRGAPTEAELDALIAKFETKPRPPANYEEEPPNLPELVRHTPRRQTRTKPVPKPAPAPHRYCDTDRPEHDFIHLSSGAELPRRRDGVLKHAGHFALWFALMGCDGTTVQDFYHNRENETKRESQVQNIVKCLDLVPEQVLMLVAEQLDDEQELIREGRIAKYPALPSLSYIGSKCLVAMSMDTALSGLMHFSSLVPLRNPKPPVRRIIL